MHSKISQGMVIALRVYSVHILKTIIVEHIINHIIISYRAVCHSNNIDRNSSVFKCLLNMDRLSPGRRSSIGREFQALGHETAKARGPIVLVLQEGTKSSPVAAERSLDRPDIVETGTHSFDRYCVCVRATYEKCKNYKFGMHIIK